MAEDKRPDFCGDWTSGFDAKLAEAAAQKQVSVSIAFDTQKKSFTINTGGHVQKYVLGGSSELSAVFGNIVFWDADTLVSKPPPQNTSANKVQSRRSLNSAGQMVLKMNNGKETAIRYFERRTGPTATE